MQQLNDFTFTVFQRLLCDDDYTIFENKEEGDRLAAEFSEIISSKKGLELVELENEIQYLVLQIETAKLFIESLKNGYDPDIAEVLRTDLDFGYELSEESYLADLNTISVECTGWESRLKTYVDQREEKNQAMSGKRATRKDFSKYSNSMRKAGFIIPNDITALDWATAFKEFRDKTE